MKRKCSRGAEFTPRVPVADEHVSLVLNGLTGCCDKCIRERTAYYSVFHSKDRFDHNNQAYLYARRTGK